MGVRPVRTHITKKVPAYRATLLYIRFIIYEYKILSKLKDEKEKKYFKQNYKIIYICIKKKSNTNSNCESTETDKN